MSWSPPVAVVSREGLWIQGMKVDLDEVEVGDLYGMQDPEMDLFRVQRVLAVNCDKTLTVQDKWSYHVRNIHMDVLLKPDYLSVPSDPTPTHWGRPLPLCKDGFNNCYG